MSSGVHLPFHILLLHLLINLVSHLFSLLLWRRLLPRRPFSFLMTTVGFWVLESLPFFKLLLLLFPFWNTVNIYLKCAYHKNEYLKKYLYCLKWKQNPINFSTVLGNGFNKTEEQTRNQSDVSSNPIEGSCCFCKQKTIPWLLSTGFLLKKDLSVISQ